jgi:hypothetical protein
MLLQKKLAAFLTSAFSLSLHIQEYSLSLSKRNWRAFLTSTLSLALLTLPGKYTRALTFEIGPLYSVSIYDIYQDTDF